MQRSQTICCAVGILSRCPERIGFDLIPAAVSRGSPRQHAFVPKGKRRLPQLLLYRRCVYKKRHLDTNPRVVVPCLISAIIAWRKVLMGGIIEVYT